MGSYGKNFFIERGISLNRKILHPEVVEEILKLTEQVRQDLGDDLVNEPGKNRKARAIIIYWGQPADVGIAFKNTYATKLVQLIRIGYNRAI